MFIDELLDSVGGAGWGGLDRFSSKVGSDVVGEAVVALSSRRGVSAMVGCCSQGLGAGVVVA